MYSSILKETYTLLYYVFICIYTVNYLTDSVCIEGGDIPNPWHTFWSKNTISGPFYSQNPQNCSCRAPSFSSKVWSLASGRLDVVRPSPTSASKLSSNFAFSKWGRLLDSHRLATVLRKFCRENGGNEVWQAGLDLQGSRMLLDKTSQLSFFRGWNCVTRAPLLYFIRSWVALSFICESVSQSVRHAWHQISTLCNI